MPYLCHDREAWLHPSLSIAALAVASWFKIVPKGTPNKAHSSHAAS